jgi:hypothetical protein
MAEGRRYLGLETLANARLTLVTDTGTEEVNADNLLELSALRHHRRRNQSYTTARGLTLRA